MATTGDGPDEPARPAVASLTIADEPDAWASAGFTVDDGGTCRLGPVRLVLAGAEAGRGVVGWALRDLPEGAGTELDGFPTEASDVGPVEPVEHPNSAVAVDHLVLLTDDLDRTVAAAAGVGLSPRRWRDHSLPDGTPVRQVFFWVGPVILELVAPRERPGTPRPGVRSFGLAVIAADLSAAGALLGDNLSSVRRAVQPGRFIATVRRQAFGLTTPLAFMSPPPRRPPPQTTEAPIPEAPDGPFPRLIAKSEAARHHVSHPASVIDRPG